MPTSSSPLNVGARPPLEQAKSTKATPSFSPHPRALRTRKEDEVSEGDNCDKGASTVRIEGALSSYNQAGSGFDGRQSEFKGSNLPSDKASSPIGGEFRSSYTKNRSNTNSSSTAAPRNFDQRVSRPDRSSLMSISADLVSKNGVSLLAPKSANDVCESREPNDVSQSVKIMPTSTLDGIRFKDGSRNMRASPLASQRKQCKEPTYALKIDLPDSTEMHQPHPLEASPGPSHGPRTASPEMKRIHNFGPNSSRSKLKSDCSPQKETHFVRQEETVNLSSDADKNISHSVAYTSQTPSLDHKQSTALEASVTIAKPNNRSSLIPDSSSGNLQPSSSNKIGSTRSTEQEVKDVGISVSHNPRSLMLNAKIPAESESAKSAAYIENENPSALSSVKSEKNSYAALNNHILSQKCSPKSYKRELKDSPRDVNGEGKLVSAKQSEKDLQIKAETDIAHPHTPVENQSKRNTASAETVSERKSPQRGLVGKSESGVEMLTALNADLITTTSGKVASCPSEKSVSDVSALKKNAMEKSDTNSADQSLQHSEASRPNNSFDKRHISMTLKKDEQIPLKHSDSAFQKSFNTSLENRDASVHKSTSNAMPIKVGETTGISKDSKVLGCENKLDTPPDRRRKARDEDILIKPQEGSTDRDGSDSRSIESDKKMKTNELQQEMSNCKIHENSAIARFNDSPKASSAFVNLGANDAKNKMSSEELRTLLRSKSDTGKKRRSDERERFRDLVDVAAPVESKLNLAFSNNETLKTIEPSLPGSSTGAVSKEKGSCSAKTENLHRSHNMESQVVSDIPSTLPPSHCRPLQSPTCQMPRPIPMPAPALSLLRSSPRSRTRSGGIEGKLNSLASLLNPSSTPPLHPTSSTPTGEQEKSERFRNDLLTRIHELEGKIITVERKQAILKSNQTSKILTVDQDDKKASFDQKGLSNCDANGRPSIANASEHWKRAKLNLKSDSHFSNENMKPASKRSLHPVHGHLRLLLTQNQCVAAASAAEFRHLCHDSEGINAEPIKEIEDWQLSEQKLKRVAIEIHQRKQNAIERRRKLAREYARTRESWLLRLKSVHEKRSKEKRDAIRERDRLILLSTRGQNALLTSKTSSGRTTTRLVPSVGWNGPSDGTAELDALLTEIEAEGGTPGARDIWSRTLAKVPDQDLSMRPCDSSSVLVENPVADWHASRATNPWMIHEKLIFLDKFIMYPKNFRKIASFLEHKSTQDCAKFYFDNKLELGIKQLLKESTALKRKGILRAQIVSTALKRHSCDSGLVLAVTNAGLLQMTDAKQALDMFLSDKEIQLRDVSRGVKQLHLNMEERGDWGVYPMKVTEKFLNEWEGVALDGIDHASFMQAYRKHGTDWRAIGVMIGGTGKTSAHYREYYRRNCRRIIGEVYTKLMPSKGSKNSGSKTRVSNVAPPSKIISKKQPYHASTHNGPKIERKNRKGIVDVDDTEYKPGGDEMEISVENRDESQYEIEDDDEDDPVEADDTESDNAEVCDIKTEEVGVESRPTERIKKLNRVVREDGT